ncbi:hypothetical protein XFF6990_450067 [Xanthomonas citri pv. fuscans]|nr:hypothetical protein XFF6990_450067 [Xanthomonas citri pv. fuscans]
MGVGQAYPSSWRRSCDCWLRVRANQEGLYTNPCRPSTSGNQFPSESPKACLRGRLAALKALVMLQRQANPPSPNRYLEGR